MKTSFDISVNAIGMFSLLRYLSEFKVRCTISALAISAAMASISFSNPVRLNGILKILRMWVVIMQEAGLPPPL